MVGAAIINTSFSSVDSSASSSSSSKKNNSNDFAKIFEGQNTNNSVNGNEDKVSLNSKDVKVIVKKFFSDTSKTDDITDEKITEDVISNVVEAYNQIINTIAENLDCTTEEVEQAMDDLGISADDLLNTQNINQLICKITDTSDMAEVITNPILSENIKDIYSEINGIVSKFEEKNGITNEELKDLLSQLIPEETKSNSEELIVNKENIVGTTETDITNENKTEDNFISQDINKTNETVKTQETNDASNSSLSEKNSSQEDTELNENNIVDLVGNIKETIVESISDVDAEIADKIVKQITDDIQLYAKADTTSLEIQLEPESLGKVSLTVASKAGVVSAQLSVQNEVAKEAIESQMSTLKETLNNQGIKIEAIEVTIASKEFEQNLDKKGNSSEQGGNKHHRHISDEELAEINGIKKNEETVMESMLKDMGNTVSYSA